MSRSRALLLAVVIMTALGIATVWAMLAPIRMDSREQLFEIPAGTWERRAAGNKVDILPSEIYLTLKIKDILVLRNLDKVPQIFGPVLIMPGQSFKLPFNLASDYQFECTAHTSGQMTVIVDPEPVAGWSRLAWRVKSAIRFLKSLR
jgi:hypothetical protein